MVPRVKNINFINYLEMISVTAHKPQAVVACREDAERRPLSALTPTGIKMGGAIVGDDGLTNEERNQCREAFEKFDKDNSGAISDWELKQMLQCTLRPWRTVCHATTTGRRDGAQYSRHCPCHSYGSGPNGRGDIRYDCSSGR